MFFLFIRDFLFLIPFLYLLPGLMGLNGVWASLPISNVTILCIDLPLDEERVWETAPGRGQELTPAGK